MELTEVFGFHQKHWHSPIVLVSNAANLAFPIVTIVRVGVILLAVLRGVTGFGPAQHAQKTAPNTGVQTIASAVWTELNVASVFVFAFVSL